MTEQLRDAIRNLHGDQRRVVLAALAVLASLLTPWYTKVTTTAPFPFSAPETEREAKLAILVPSFVEASIILVALAVVALMLARGARLHPHLPASDRKLVTAAGAWVFLLVFWRFIDQPSINAGPGTTAEYQLSWGIFFGLLSSLLLADSGLLLHEHRTGSP